MTNDGPQAPAAREDSRRADITPLPDLRHNPAKAGRCVPGTWCT